MSEFYEERYKEFTKRHKDLLQGIKAEQARLAECERELFRCESQHHRIDIGDELLLTQSWIDYIGGGSIGVKGFTHVGPPFVITAMNYPQFTCDIKSREDDWHYVVPLPIIDEMRSAYLDSVKDEAHE